MSRRTLIFSGAAGGAMLAADYALKHTLTGKLLRRSLREGKLWEDISEEIAQYTHTRRDIHLSGIQPPEKAREFAHMLKGDYFDIGDGTIMGVFDIQDANLFNDDWQNGTPTNIRLPIPQTENIEDESVVFSHSSRQKYLLYAALDRGVLPSKHGRNEKRGGLLLTKEGGLQVVSSGDASKILQQGTYRAFFEYAYVINSLRQEEVLSQIAEAPSIGKDPLKTVEFNAFLMTMYRRHVPEKTILVSTVDTDQGHPVMTIPEMVDVGNAYFTANNTVGMTHYEMAIPDPGISSATIFPTKYHYEEASKMKNGSTCPRKPQNPDALSWYVGIGGYEDRALNPSQYMPEYYIGIPL